MSTAFIHNLGDRAKCRVSGQTGIITSRSEHLFGCSRYWIEPPVDKDGKPQDGRWIDEDSLETIEVGVVKPKVVRMVPAADPYDASAGGYRRTGGPSNQPASHGGNSTR